MKTTFQLVMMTKLFLKAAICLLSFFSCCSKELEFLAPASDKWTFTKCVGEIGNASLPELAAPLFVSFSAPTSASQICTTITNKAVEPIDAGGTGGSQQEFCLNIKNCARSFSLNEVAGGTISIRAQIKKDSGQTIIATRSITVNCVICDVTDNIPPLSYRWVTVVQRSVCTPQESIDAKLFYGTGTRGAIRNEEQWMFLMRDVFRFKKRGVFVEAGILH